MDAFKGVTFQDWACAATHMGAGMTEQGVCEVLGLTTEDWQEANSYWLSNLQAMLASNPNMMTAYMNYCQNPKQGKFAAVQGGPRPLQYLLTIVPDYATFARINQQYLEASEVEGANMIEFFRGHGLTLVEWGELGKYWAPRSKGYVAPASKASTKEGQPAASQTSSGTQGGGTAASRSSSGIAENDLKFFTKTGPGVFVLKQPVFLPALIMAGCLLGAVAFAVWGLAFAHDNTFLIGSVILLAFFVKTLLEVLIKTVFDQNTRTITGLLTSIFFIKLKSTVSFNDFKSFYHVTKTSRSSTGVGLNTETWLEMRFIVDGKAKNVTLLKMPSKEKMDRVCAEIMSLMKAS